VYIQSLDFLQVIDTPNSDLLVKAFSLINNLILSFTDATHITYMVTTSRICVGTSQFNQNYSGLMCMLFFLKKGMLKYEK